MENLINQLTNSTQDLKIQYIESTKKWAEKYFNSVIVRLAWKDEDWCKFLGLVPVERGNYMSKWMGFPDGFYNSSKARELDRLQSEVRRLKGLGLEGLIAKEVKAAEEHYTGSIQKLAERIIKKGLSLDTIEVKSASIGVNINITITDGNKSVRAWTIVAEGAIQKPHYRYLVK